MNSTQTLNERLMQLVHETCGYPHGTIERQQGLNQIVGLVQHSGKLWRAANQADLPQPVT